MSEVVIGRIKADLAALRSEIRAGDGEAVMRLVSAQEDRLLHDAARRSGALVAPGKLTPTPPSVRRTT